MDPHTGGTKQKKPSPSSSWSRASTRLGLRFRSSTKPSISAPIGPVKNSRGPDFTRSETLIIVDEIKDCATTKPASSLNTSLQTISTRRIPTSFSSQSLVSYPTVAKSNVTVSTGIKTPLKKRSINKLREASAYAQAPRPTLPRPRLTSSSTAALLIHVDNPGQDENKPPGSHGLNKNIEAEGQTKIPKSRTMTVLQDWKASVSRSPHNSKKGPTIYNPEQSASPSLASMEIRPSSSNVQLPLTAQTSVSVSTCASGESISMATDPSQVSAAQPSQYWTGRFLSLHDKLSAENLATDSLRSLAATYKQGTHNSLSLGNQQNLNKFVPPVRQTHLPHATTTSSLTTLMKPPKQTSQNQPESDPVERIFAHLDAHCLTEDARESLHDWQQEYARRHKRPDLLPRGRAMEGPRLMGKWFGNHNQKASSRPSLTALRDAANSRLGIKTVAAKSTGAHGQAVAGM